MGRLNSLAETYRLRFPHADPRPFPAYEVDIISAVPEMDEWISRLFSPFILNPSSFHASTLGHGNGSAAVFRLFRDGRRGRDPDGRIRLQRPGMRSVSAGGPAEMAGELEYSLFEHVSWNLKGYFQFHAALAAKDGCGVLIPGRTRSGKTTLALSLWRLGWNVFTDDMSFLEPKSGLFLPFPRPFNLREETLTLLKPETAGCEIPVGPPDFDAPSAYFHPCWLPGRNGLLPKPTGVRWIIFPTRRERARKKPDLRPLRPSQAIRRLVPSAYILKETRVRGLEIVSGLIDATEHYELVMGAPEETASLMDEQLGLAGVKDEGVSPGRGRA